MSTPESKKIRVWIDGKSRTGFLVVDRDGIHIKLESGEVISDTNQQTIYYELSEQNVSGTNSDLQSQHIEFPIRVKLQPLVKTLRNYSPRAGQYIEDIFPPSSFGFYGRIKHGNEKHLFVVQETSLVSKLWLTIANPSTGEIYETHTIYPYEAEFLSLNDNQEFRRIWYQTIWSQIPETERKELFSILESPSVSWNELGKILGDVSIPNLQLGGTMRETLSPLIPKSFPNDIQEQLMLFLTLILKNNMPREDPIDYLYKFWQFPILGALMEGHLMFLADGIDWPPYLKLLILSERKELIAPTRAIAKGIQDSPWLLFWQKIVELLPNWMDIAIDVVDDLTKKKKIISKVPITKAAAEKSMGSWKKRLALLVYELRILGRVNHKSLGLSKLVYLGSAYRWPHRHMEFITRLGGAGESIPYLHVMVLPSTAASQIKRALPTVIDVGLTLRTSNIELFDKKSKDWIIPIGNILESVEKRSSVRQLKNRYNVESKVGFYQINEEEAKVLDLASEGIRIAGLEREEYLAPWGFDSKRVQRLLTKLSNSNIVQLRYEASNQNLVSLATVVQGPPKKVVSVSHAFLQFAPTTLMMLGDDAEQSILISRLPEESIYEIATELPRVGLDYDLTIRCLRPTTFQSFAHNLYQRLLRDDGTWDDDVSAFLSQARSKRKELSESNL